MTIKQISTTFTLSGSITGWTSVFLLFATDNQLSLLGAGIGLGLLFASILIDALVVKDW